MNSATSTIKQILRHKISNGFVLFTAIWSSAIMPVMPSYAKMLTPDDLPTLGSDPVLTNDDKTEKLIAEYSQSAARFISDKKKAADLADMAQDFARSKVTNAATDEINRWLSKTGNAKFSVDVDKKLSIKNTQLDWLVPWYDSTDLLLFTQHNIHRTDGRLQTNNGIGVRRFTPKSMMGVNAFFDHDLSRYHSRLGFGAEYAQDFLKLSANTYLRASEWRSASELNNDYNARPANGWDLQAEGWLPSYPNIGGNLKFEQYFGDDVALFGKDKRQKDPLATTVGVNWTPFSLMTLSAEHKISGGLSETNAKLEFTWALGKSLAEQLDPTKVGDSRRLLGSRYDFVNRNNNIILEYQKKTLITLSLPAIIQGKTGDEIPLINALNTKYSLDKLTIHAPEFLMAGGEIILDGALTKIKLPSYKVAMTEQERKKNNLYRFTVTASDSKGNITPQASTFVEVTNSGVLSIKHNEVIKKGNFLANGQDINALTVTARDVLGNVAPDSTVTFTLPAELKLVTQKATSSSMAFKNLYKKMQAAKSTDKQKYKHANPVVGETNITIKIAGKEHILQTKEVTSGIYEITLPAQQQGHYEIIAVVNKFESQKKVLVVEKPKPIKAINLSGSGLQGERGVIDKIDMTLANTANLHSGDSLDVTVTLSDIFGNTLTGIDSSNLVLSGYKTDTLVWKDNGDGSYSTMLALTQTGAHDLIASISGKKTPKAQIQVHNATSSTKAANIIFDPISTSEAGETQTITLKITDANHHPVAEIANEIHLIIEGQKEVFQLTKSTKGPGIYTAILPGRLSGTYTVKASVNQKIESRIWYVSKASTITANPTGQPNERGSVDRIEFQTSPRHSLKVGDTLTLIATLKDAFGNTLKGMDTTLIDLPSGQNGNAPWKDNLDGTYHSNLILDTLGKDKLVAKANKKITSDEIIIDVANSEQVAHVTAVELEAIPSTSAGTEQTITVKAYGFGSRKYAITNIADAITVKIDSKDIPIRFTEHKNVKGTYTSTLPAMLSGKYTVEAKVGKQSASMSWVVNTTSTITVVPVGQAGTRGVVNNISLTTSTLSALKSGDILQLTVTAKDAFGNSLKGIDTSNITLTHTQKTKVTWKDNQNGSYTANLLLTQLASDTVKVSINGQSQDVNISVGNTSESTQIASVVLEPIYASEAGEAQTMTVKVTDQYQHPVTAIGDHISVKVNNQPKKIQFTDSVSNIGVYTATLPAEKMGDYTVEVSANKQVASRTWQVKKPAIITAKNNDGSGSENQRGVVKTVELSSSSTNDLKSGDSLQLTVTLKDAFGNYLEGINASHIQLKNKQANTISWSDNRNGRYTAVLPLTNIGEDSLVATINRHPSSPLNIKVGNATGTTQVKQVEIKSITKPAAGETSTITLALTDANNQPIIGIDNNAVVSIDGAEQLLKITETNNKGTYTATLSGQKSGDHEVIVTIGGVKSTGSTLTVDAPMPIAINHGGKSGSRGVIDRATLTVSPHQRVKVR
ncbi:inverse autotransporter beta domain-containing protein [Providencia rettgeri]|nr:inverse autotransporter beta domain-containing protein [Providencia rettgeri]